MAELRLGFGAVLFAPNSRFILGDLEDIWWEDSGIVVMPAIVACWLYLEWLDLGNAGSLLPI